MQVTYNIFIEENKDEFKRPNEDANIHIGIPTSHGLSKLLSHKMFETSNSD